MKSAPALDVYCKFPRFAKSVIGWIVIQRRFSNGLNFDRTWQEYKDGFGDLNSEFWMGLEKLHMITNGYKSYRLQVTVTDEQGGIVMSGVYEDVKVRSEKEDYRLDGYFKTGTSSLLYI